jgi:RecA-family ATPase
LGRRLEVVRLGEVEQPGPRRYVVEELVPAGYSTLWHGDGGVAKSMIALSLGVGVASGAMSWLGRAVEHGPALFVDFELEAEEQARRVWQLCRGIGLKEPPADLFYLSAVGHPTRDALRAALQACEEGGVTLVVVDSLGPALEGDAEAARDVIGFYRDEIDPFRALGAAVLIIDHQAKLQHGESYQRKGAFGSVYKANLARSVVQAEATERGEGTLSLRIRQKKHNFGPLADPFGVELSFSEELVSLRAVDLDPAQMAEEATLTAPERVKLALQDGPLYPSEIVEATGVQVKTVKRLV